MQNFFFATRRELEKNQRMFPRLSTDDAASALTVEMGKLTRAIHELSNHAEPGSVAQTRASIHAERVAGLAWRIWSILEGNASVPMEKKDNALVLGEMFAEVDRARLDPESAARLFCGTLNLEVSEPVKAMLQSNGSHQSA
ncbi:hypothetical protein [uncultured Desulfovibrio sp.]|uniref:hypothetical protein n=1 Tax=uncultured Desulfovibrio sp. TaxID=167968 RepID=UPI00267275BA|nr:hypothetical protein [uncultured Desulfovibrio sp.]